MTQRRLATALGSWGATALGILGTVVAARVLDPGPFGRLTLVLATVALFQLLLDLTSEEALVKYGFRYAERAASPPSLRGGGGGGGGVSGRGGGGGGGVFFFFGGGAAVRAGGRPPPP